MLGSSASVAGMFLKYKEEIGYKTVVLCRIGLRLDWTLQFCRLTSCKDMANDLQTRTRATGTQYITMQALMDNEDYQHQDYNDICERPHILHPKNPRRRSMPRGVELYMASHRRRRLMIRTRYINLATENETRGRHSPR